MAVTCKQIINLSRGGVVCERAVVADHPLRRMRGLLGQSSLSPGEGMLLTPAPSIHTAFMRFSIDVVFADRWLCVVKLAEHLAPWRMASARHARYALELAAGEVARRGIAPGDQLAIGAPAGEIDSAGDSWPPGLRDAGEGDDREGRRARPGEHPGAQLNGLNSGDRPDGYEDAFTAAGTGVGQAPIHVLLVGSDRRFRTLARTLLEHRGLIVATAERATPRDRQALAGADVVLLDAGDSLSAAARDAATLQRLAPDVALVTVAEHPRESSTSLAALPKWGSFDVVVDAIQMAHVRRRALEAPGHGQSDGRL